MLAIVFFSKAMGRNLRTLMLRHKDMLSNNPGIDIEAVLSNPNMTLYEVDTVVTSKGNGYVRDVASTMPKMPGR